MSDVPPSPEGQEYMQRLADAPKFDAVCQVPRCGWRSTEWPSEEAANKRLEEHYAEHETGNPAPELVESEATQMTTEETPNG